MRREIKSNPCVICKTTLNIDPCHIRTWKVTGVDSKWNIIPMCRTHHMRQHQIGWERFMEEFPQVKKTLKDLGWDWEKANGKIYLYHEGFLNENNEG